jgi:hypothetical protein
MTGAKKVAIKRMRHSMASDSTKMEKVTITFSLRVPQSEYIIFKGFIARASHLVELDAREHSESDGFFI